jgi:drug/metabolite transporter (DMT)-like permease
MIGLELGVGLLVGLAAVLHAAWNALTKSSGDALLAMWLIALVSAGVGAVGAFFVPLPDAAAWPYLIVSMAIHLAYMLFLVRGYEHGDLSRVYPIARGMAPAIVAALAAVWVGEVPSPAQALGLLLCCVAIASLAFADVGVSDVSGRAVRAAMATGVAIGGYTVVDGSGVRVTADPFSYVAWNLLLDGIPLTFVVFAKRRGQIGAFLRSKGAHSLAGGVMAAVAYGIVMWAMSRGALASVSSLRETSVVFAALIGSRMLGEPMGGRRLLAAAGVAAGLLILHA